MDWFQRWPKDALIAVADHFLSKFQIDCTIDVKKQLIVSMGSIHDDVAESCASYFRRYHRANTSGYLIPSKQMFFNIRRKFNRASNVMIMYFLNAIYFSVVTPMAERCSFNASGASLLHATLGG
jgi:P-loop containing dynein motor region D4